MAARERRKRHLSCTEAMVGVSTVMERAARGIVEGVRPAYLLNNSGLKAHALAGCYDGGQLA
jgi:hypothetical protein